MVFASLSESELVGIGRLKLNGVPGPMKLGVLGDLGGKKANSLGPQHAAQGLQRLNNLPRPHGHVVIAQRTLL